MEHFAEKLTEELSVHTVFHVPYLGGISESVVVTWGLMAAFLIFSIIVTRNLKVENPGRGQLLLEAAVTGIRNIVAGILGEEGGRYVDYMSSTLLFLLAANLVAILGFKPPTKDLNVTAALALFSIFLIEFAGIRHKGVFKWVKSFAKPLPVMTPINILELFTRPLSLCMRLFGNVLGAFAVMKLIEAVLPVGLPVIFGIYFDVFDGVIQAYVFVFLTGLFISEQLE